VGGKQISRGAQSHSAGGVNSHPVHTASALRAQCGNSNSGLFAVRAELSHVIRVGAFKQYITTKCRGGEVENPRLTNVRWQEFLVPFGFGAAALVFLTLPVLWQRDECVTSSAKLARWTRCGRPTFPRGSSHPCSAMRDFRACTN
jgi:hypothetical protein